MSETTYNVNSNGDSTLAQVVNRFEEVHGLVNGFVLHMDEDFRKHAAEHIAAWTAQDQDETELKAKEVRAWLDQHAEFIEV